MSTLNILRYNSDLISNYKMKCLFLVDDPEEIENLKLEQVEVLCTAGWTVEKIKRYLLIKGISTILISGQRLADVRFLIAANSLEIKVIYKMHGLYVPFMKRNLTFFLTKYKKTFRTIFYLFNIAYTLRKPSLFVGLSSSFLFGTSRASWAAIDELRVDYILIWSDYWKKWHEDHWLMRPRLSWLNIGNPDTSKFNNIEVEDSNIIYIYQTLVEDGRISWVVMEQFYNNLKAIANKTGLQVLVKWHPRGSRKIRDYLVNCSFSICDDFPVGKHYIGHYSSLLGLVPMVGGSVTVFELPGHPTPKPISSIANTVTSSYVEFSKASWIYTIDSPANLHNSEYYFGGMFDPSVEYKLINALVRPSASIG